MSTQKKPVKQAHGMSHSQMEQLKQKQMDGTVEMVPANRGNDIKDPYFKEAYEGHQIPANETHIYHVAMEARLFSQATGERLSVSRVQKFDQANWDLVKDRLNGWTVEIIHNPSIDKKSK